MCGVGLLVMFDHTYGLPGKKLPLRIWRKFFGLLEAAEISVRLKAEIKVTCEAGLDGRAMELPLNNILVSSKTYISYLVLHLS